MKTYSNSMAIAELWAEGKAEVVNAKALMTNIKAASKKKLGQVTLQLPNTYIGETLPDAWGGKDMWLLFKIDPEEWDSKMDELKERDSQEQ